MLIVTLLLVMKWLLLSATVGCTHEITLDDRTIGQSNTELMSGPSGLLTNTD